MTPISRKDAHAAGLRHFYTGKPCARGHDRERAVATGSCLGCLAHYAREYSRKFKAMGVVEISVAVMPNHVSALNDFAELLRTSVVTGAAPPMVPHQDDVGTVNTMISMLDAERGVAPQPAPPPFDPYPMWVKIHGQEIADQMRESA